MTKNQSIRFFLIYQRITSKGKSKKLALIVVANKLLKQSLAIAKSGLYYDENFRSVYSAACLPTVPIILVLR